MVPKIDLRQCVRKRRGFVDTSGVNADEYNNIVLQYVQEALPTGGTAFGREGRQMPPAHLGGQDK